MIEEENLGSKTWSIIELYNMDEYNYNKSVPWITFLDNCIPPS